MAETVVIVFNNNDTIKNIYIKDDIVIILKKRMGGKYAPLLDDFALESSENLNSIFLRINSADSIFFKLIIGSVIFCPMPTNHLSFWRHFNGEYENKKK